MRDYLVSLAFYWRGTEKGSEKCSIRTQLFHTAISPHFSPGIFTELRNTTFNGWEARNPVQEFGHHLSIFHY